MAQFYATTALGLVDALENELITLGFKIERKISSGVFSKLTGKAATEPIFSPELLLGF